jgi:hypothetical protein
MQNPAKIDEPEGRLLPLLLIIHLQFVLPVRVA